MRLDDVLIYILALAATVTLFVGLARALDGHARPPRRSRRVGPAGAESVADDGSVSEATLSPLAFSLRPVAPAPALGVIPELIAVAPLVASEPVEPVKDLLRAEGPSVAAEAEAVTASAPVAEEPVVSLPEVPDVEPLAVNVSIVAPEPVAETPILELVHAEVAPQLVIENIAESKAGAALPEPTLLGQCVDLYEAAEHAKVLTLLGSRANRSGGRRAQRGKGLEPRGQERGAIQALLGLSREALGDPAGACSALRMALGAAPDPKRPLTEPEGIAAWLGRRLLASGEAAREGSELRMTALRLAVLWLDVAQRSGGAGQDAPALAERSREAFCLAAEERVNDLIQKREFGGAHALIEEILGTSAVPPARQEALRDLLWQTVTGEVGRLVGQALHATPDAGSEKDTALASLQSAEAVVAAAPTEILTAERRQDLGRRLWWGYMKLSAQRVESGDVDGGLEPLYRALLLAEADAERQGETRQTLARVVEALVDRLGEAAIARLRDGDLAAAMAESRRLSEVLDGALERGLSQEDLVGVLGKRQEIMLQLAGGA